MNKLNKPTFTNSIKWSKKERKKEIEEDLFTGLHTLITKQQPLSVGNNVYQTIEKDIAPQIKQAKEENNDELLKKLANMILQKIQFPYKNKKISNVIPGVVHDRDKFTIHPEKKTEGGITISLRNRESHIYTIITIDYYNQEATKTEREVTFQG